MKPILYNHSETSFTNNGLGRLADCISCVVTEERNGIYECQFTYPVTGEMFSEIQEGRIIAVIHDDVKDIQPFDIYAHSAPLNGVVTFYAHHISYRLGSIILKPMEASSCNEALYAIPNNTYNTCPFTFWTDKNVSGRWVNNVPSAVKAVLGGQQGSILDVYGKGEYKWDKFNVRLYVNRGNDNGVSIRYGVNLTDLNQDYDESSIYNAVVPYWVNNENGTVVTLANGIVARGRLPWTTLSGINITDRAGNIIYFGGNNRIVPVPMDLTEAFDEQPTEQQLEAEAMRRLNSSEAWLPSENITVKFVNLADTEEYKNVAALQRVSLCDKVSVYCGPLNVSAVKMQVIRVVYNVLTERYNEIELGKAKVSFTQTITAKIEEMTKDLPTKSMMQRAIDNATDMITGAMGGHVRFIYDADGEMQEIVIMDTDDIDTAVKVWRWNSGGFGFSSNGYAGPYTTAMTMDGSIVADFITTGILNAAIVKAGILGDVAGKNYWNMQTGEFSLSGDAGLGESTVGDVLDAVDAAISNVDVEYAQNQSTTTAPTSGWSTEAPQWRDGYYIWQRTATTTKTGIDYSDPTCISGRNGVDGETGSPGPQGVGIASVTEYYALNNSTTAPADSSFSTGVKTPTAANKYVWNYELITYTDNTTSKTEKHIAATYGDTGATGNGISSIVEYYAVNNSTTAPADSAFSTTISAPTAANKYLWNYEQITYTDGSTVKTGKRVIGTYGEKGDTGSQGATGIGVSAVVEQYYLSTSNSTQSGGSWSTDQPQWVSGKYIWTRSQVTWTDNTTTYTTPVLAQAINGANSTANAASNAVTTLDNSLNQQGVFNRLTNNGQTQGIYLNNGLLYINASFIKSGIIDGTVVQAKLLNIINASNTVIASFDDSIRIGKQDKVHIVIDYNSLDIYKNATSAVFLVGDLQDSNGRSRQVEHFTGDGSSKYFVIHSYRATIVSIKVNGSEVTEYSIVYRPYTTDLTLESAPENGADVRVEYTVSASVFHYDFGIRNEDSFTGDYSVIEGNNTIASGKYSHAEGSNTEAGGYCSHAEGEGTKIDFTQESTGVYDSHGGCHAEGYQTRIQKKSGYVGIGHHVEGYQCLVTGTYGNHAEGYMTKVDGSAGCHAEGEGTIARGYSQHVAGRYNVEDTGGSYAGIYAEIIGNGTSDNNRSNARTLSKAGNEWIAGTLTQASDSRLKEESGEIPDLSNIRARRFKWNDKKGTHDDLDHIGYFAQDVEKVAPYLVQEDAMGYKSLDYIALLCAKVEYLERRVQQLENEVKRHDD